MEEMKTRNPNFKVGKRKKFQVGNERRRHLKNSATVKETQEREIDIDTRQRGKRRAQQYRNRTRESGSDSRIESK